MLVSVLSPVKNEEQYLHEMIESVLAQTFPDWELIIVDDYSDDSTVAIAEAFAKANSRIRVSRSTSPPGKVGAFNAAYKMSRGDLIVLLAGDDRIPPNSLDVRVRAVGPDIDARYVGYFRLITMSADPRFDNMVIPRRKKSNRSGGTMILTRTLADEVFPIAPSLVSEDIWISALAPALADRVFESSEVVLNYRIHAQNSNPRGRDFVSMSYAMHERHRAWLELLREKRLNLPSSKREELERLWQAEQLRRSRRVLRLLLGSRLPTMQRLALASMARESLYRIRTRFYRQLSGWR